MTRPFRRRILYIPGYDPIPPRRYRELYRREGAEQARISGYRLELGRAEKLAIGRKDTLAHRALHDIGPDQHLELGFDAPAAEIAAHAPAEAGPISARAR